MMDKAGIDKSLTGVRFNAGKLKWSLVHFKSIEPLVKVLEFGAQKYAAHNWKKGLNQDEIYESMMRHMTALINGEINDPESGLPHIGHIMCNCMFGQYFNDLRDQESINQPDDIGDRLERQMLM